MIGRCPNTRMVLGGFSQGAGVIDLATPAMPPQAIDHVAAIAVFGNPTSPLASNLSGAVFPPIGPPYNSKTIDLCADGDPSPPDTDPPRVLPSLSKLWAEFAETAPPGRAARTFNTGIANAGAINTG